MTTQIPQSSHGHVASRNEIPDSASEPLTSVEQEKLTLCERTISTGWQTFVEVGLALSTIREERLYRIEYPSFEVYCSSKWQFHRAYAYRLMTAAQVVKALSPIGDTPAPAKIEGDPLTVNHGVASK